MGRLRREPAVQAGMGGRHGPVRRNGPPEGMSAVRKKENGLGPKGVGITITLATNLRWISLAMHEVACM